MTIQVKDLETREVYRWTIDQVLQEINRDRSENWINYDKSDWREGWDEWVEGDCLTMLTKENT